MLVDNICIQSINSVIIIRIVTSALGLDNSDTGTLMAIVGMITAVVIIVVVMLISSFTIVG